MMNARFTVVTKLLADNYRLLLTEESWSWLRELAYSMSVLILEAVGTLAWLPVVTIQLVFLKMGLNQVQSLRYQR